MRASKIITLKLMIFIGLLCLWHVVVNIKLDMQRWEQRLRHFSMLQGLTSDALPQAFKNGGEILKNFKTG